MTTTGLRQSGRRASNQASASSAGPSVIIRKLSDGGYFVVLKNDSTVKSALGCGDQGTGSPYILIARTMKNSTTSVAPIAIVVRRLSRGSRSHTPPKQKTAAMTPIHGSTGYATRNATPATTNTP